jgi:protein arginine kinase
VTWSFDAMMREPAAWLDASGARSEVILSTRVRLARNLEGERFPGRASRADRERVRERVLDAALRSNYLRNALVVRVEETGESSRRVLVERHLASPELACGRPGAAVVVGEREIVSAMVNEEDHLRLQCIRSGLQPVDAWRLAGRIESELDQNLHYAFLSDWGYLTACPTNVGTGMRVSVLAHLAGLARCGRVAQVLGSVSKLGLSVRGFYGEGSASQGAFFQVSNQTTLGQTEDDTAYTVERVAGQLSNLESEARNELAGGRRLADDAWRAWGVLRSARLLTAGEVMELGSSLRVGVAEGIIDAVPLSTVNRLLVLTQPGHVAYAKDGASAEERDALRADIVRRELATVQ